MAYFNTTESKDDAINDRVIQIDRITRVVKGGRRLRFRAIVVAGDGNGQVGLAVDKGGEVVDAISKATRKAKNQMKTINLKGTTIPHEVTAEYAGAKVFLKPAPKGTGVIAGGAVRPILEVLGVKDVLSKIQGSSSKLNNAYATIIALQNLRAIPTEDKKNVKKTEVKETASFDKPKKATPKKTAKKTEKVAKESGSSDLSAGKADIKSGSRPAKVNK